MLDSGVPLILLDARSGKYDDGTSIPGALSLNAESKPEEIARILPKKVLLSYQSQCFLVAHFILAIKSKRGF